MPVALLALAAVVGLCALVARMPGGEGPYEQEGGGVAAPALAEGARDEYAEALVDSARTEARTSEKELADEAGDLLVEACARGDCVLASSGYLDLLGSTWGFVLQGEGWVEVCVVQERLGGGCEVRTWRMDASEVPRPGPGGSGVAGSRP